MGPSDCFWVMSEERCKGTECSQECPLKSHSCGFDCDEMTGVCTEVRSRKLCKDPKDPKNCFMQCPMDLEVCDRACDDKGCHNVYSFE